MYVCTYSECVWRYDGNDHTKNPLMNLIQVLISVYLACFSSAPFKCRYKYIQYRNHHQNWRKSISFHNVIFNIYIHTLYSTTYEIIYYYITFYNSKAHHAVNEKEKLIFKDFKEIN